MHALSWVATAGAVVGCILLAVQLFVRKGVLERTALAVLIAAMLAYIPLDVHRGRTGALVLDVALALFWGAMLVHSVRQRRKAVQS